MVKADEDVDYTYDQEEADEYKGSNYNDILKKSVNSFESDMDYDADYDDDDQDVIHYIGMGGIELTTFETVEKKIIKGTIMDLTKGYIETSNKQYSIDLSDASWSVIENKKYIDVKDGICTVTSYPTKGTTSVIRATKMKVVDGDWRKLAVYFYVTPTKNTAMIDSIRTIPINKKSTLEIINNSTKSKSIKWATDNSKIATVSKNGVVSAKANGKCIITATLSDGYKLKCQIIVPSKTESTLLNNAKGTYSGTYEIGTYEHYKITINESSIGGNPYEVIKLDRQSIEGLDVFYVKLYDKYSGAVIQNKTFALHYSSDKKENVSFIWWYKNSEPSWDAAILD
jgi:hypothetical protein